MSDELDQYDQQGLLYSHDLAQFVHTPTAADIIHQMRDTVERGYGVDVARLRTYKVLIALWDEVFATNGQ